MQSTLLNGIIRLRKAKGKKNRKRTGQKQWSNLVAENRETRQRKDFVANWKIKSGEEDDLMESGRPDAEQHKEPESGGSPSVPRRQGKGISAKQAQRSGVELRSCRFGTSVFNERLLAKKLFQSQTGLDVLILAY